MLNFKKTVEKHVPEKVLEVDPSIKGLLINLLESAWREGYFDGLEVGKAAIQKKIDEK